MPGIIAALFCPIPDAYIVVRLPILPIEHSSLSNVLVPPCISQLVLIRPPLILKSMDSQTADTPPARNDHTLLKDEEKASGSTSSQLQVPGKDFEGVPDGAEPPRQEHEYVSGFKLALILISITAVYFLMMLDMSILATVSQRLNTPASTVLLTTQLTALARPFLTSLTTSTPSSTWDGMAVRISSHGRSTLVIGLST
jgi:hypothetical protein